MTTWRTVMNGILAQVNAALAGNSVPYDAAVSWPPPNRLSMVATTGRAAITVFDRKTSKDTTRWAPYLIGEVDGVVGITASVTLAQVVPSGSGVVTIIGSANANDAIALVVDNGAPGAPNSTRIGVVYEPPTAGMTAAQVAAGLLAAMQANATLMTWITASSAGAAITVTNQLGVSLGLGANTGNIGTQTIEPKRTLRDVQVVCWAKTADQRDTLCDAIESTLAQVQANFLQFADGNFGRVILESDMLIEEDIQQDVYRRDFFLSVEYGVSFQQTVWSVLVPQPGFSVETALQG